LKKIEIGARYAAEDQTAGTDEGDVQEQDHPEQDEQNGRAMPGRKSHPSSGDHADGGPEQPDAQGEQIDQFDTVERDIQFPEQDNLPQDGNQSDG
jgi:hypothetical protein